VDGATITTLARIAAVVARRARANTARAQPRARRDDAAATAAVDDDDDADAVVAPGRCVTAPGDGRANVVANVAIVAVARSSASASASASDARVGPPPPPVGQGRADAFF
jgi:hypothetical protein